MPLTNTRAIAALRQKANLSRGVGYLVKAYGISHADAVEVQRRLRLAAGDRDGVAQRAAKLRAILARRMVESPGVIPDIVGGVSVRKVAERNDVRKSSVQLIRKQLKEYGELTARSPRQVLADLSA